MESKRINHNLHKELKLVDFKEINGWRITYSQLYDIDPSLLEGETASSIWPLIFVQDLLQIEDINEKNSLMLVGIQMGTLVGNIRWRWLIR